MSIPLIILAIGSIFSGMLFFDIFVGTEKYYFWYHSIIVHHEDITHMSFIQVLIIKSSVAFGIILAAIMYYFKKEYAQSIPSDFILYSFFRNKCYVDELYDIVFTRPFFYLASFFWKRGDQKSIDAFGPDGVSKIINLLGRFCSYLQTGFLYHYVFAMFIGLVIILSWFFYF